MKKVAACLLLLATASLAVSVRATSAQPAEHGAALFKGVENAARAKMNYALNCQGCHLASGAGMPGKVPNMIDTVSRFLHASGGREYIARVPGMTNAAVSDEELAELANWTLYTFDPAHVPEDFEPYTAREIARFRRAALVSAAAAERARLLKALDSAEDEK